MEHMIDRRNRNTDVGNFGDRGRVLKVIFFSAVLATSGCSFLPSHFHDAEKAAVATKLEKELAAYEENAPSMYEAMLTNVEKFRVEEDKVIADLAANRDNAFVTLLPIHAWSQLCKDGSKVKRSIIDLNTQVKNEAMEYQRKSRVLEGEIRDAKDAAEKASEAVEKAKKNVERWNESIALLKKGFSKLLSLANNNAKNSTDGSSSSLLKALEGVGNEEIEFLDAEGNSKKKSIKDILKEQIESEGSGRLSFLLPEAPGITVTIVTLGLELAELQKKETELQLVLLVRRAELYEDTYGKIRLAGQLLKDSEFAKVPEFGEDPRFEEELKQCQAQNKFGEPSSHYMLKAATEARSLYRRMEEAKGENRGSEAQKFFIQILDMKEILKGLRKLALADSISKRTEAMLKIDLARLDHEESILRSRVHDEAWRATLKSGVTGLVTYHQGGFSAEDAAQIIRIAQTVALGIIANGVN